MNNRKVKVGLIQMACSEDVEGNTAKLEKHIRSAAAKGAQIICTQELFRSPYFCKREDPALFDLAEPIPGPSTSRLQVLAKELNVVIVGSLFERRAAGLYHNTAVIIDAGGELLGIYRKMHIPDDPLYYEKYYFTPGDLGFKAWDTKYGRIGVLVCWDQWYPEGARLTAMQGADILFYPTAIGWHEHEKEEFGTAQYDAWQTIQRSHSIANGVYVCSVNRIGKEESVEFFGGSFVSDPFGRLLHKASHDQEEIIVQELDLSKVEETRQHWPFFRDRRVETYAPIASRFLV
ncbi:MAG TPA: carbon-nitrogen hydrolase [Candidatus Sumerlaeota bacterium]|nr:carbon-nitrogen hydrolase [Candidatus Sumerlaeota bacterium]HNM46451.1 carbon-nitrogen hydrolase [Candidatus Sumerlaeota bacterium]